MINENKPSRIDSYFRELKHKKDFMSTLKKTTMNIIVGAVATIFLIALTAYFDN